MENAYDEAGNMILLAGYDSHVNDIWIGSNKYVFVYDETGNQIRRERYQWDSEMKDWVGDNKQVSKINKNKNIILVETFRWDIDYNNWTVSDMS